jgi:hypothetical protein
MTDGGFWEGDLYACAQRRHDDFRHCRFLATDHCLFVEWLGANQGVGWVFDLQGDDEFGASTAKDFRPRRSVPAPAIKAFSIVASFRLT